MQPKERVIVCVILLLSLCTKRSVSFSLSRHHYHQSCKRASVECHPLFSTPSEDNEPFEYRPEDRPGSLAAAIAEQGRVPYGESSRKYRRTVFSHKDWLVHRKSGRSFENLKGIFFSGIVRQLQREVFLVSFVALAVVLWNGVLVPSEAAGGMLPSVSLPSLPFTLSSPALGLLLVFRTNSSYARWLEARVKWGTIVTQSRNMVRMATTFVDINDPEARETLEYLALTTWAFSRTFMNALSGPDDEVEYREEMQSTYPDGSEVASSILAAPDRTMAAMTELSLALDAIPIDEKRRVEIDKSIVIIGDCVGACERIFSSPVPLVYTRHTARFLTLWMLLVPTALYDTFASVQDIETLLVVPAVAIMGLFLFGIEELAVQLEEVRLACDCLSSLLNSIIVPRSHSYPSSHFRSYQCKSSVTGYESRLKR